MRRRLVFLDSETTGVHQGSEVWEVAMIARDPGQEDREVHFFIANPDLSNADPFGLQVGRFYERHPQFNGTTTLWSEPEDFHKYHLMDKGPAASLIERTTRGALIIGAVPNFDTERLDPLLRGEYLAPSWRYHLRDVETLAVGWLKGKGLLDPRLVDEDWKSDDLVAMLGLTIDEKERHTALGDARLVRDIYDLVFGG